MDIFLVRHGEAASSWGKAADPGLSELGQRQAEHAAQVLHADLPADTILLSSPLARALETAAPLARLRGVEIGQQDVFREIPAPVPMPQRQEWLQQFMQQQWHEQQESLHSWRRAAYQHLVALQQPTVVFTHFLVINTVVGKVLNKSATLCFWPGNASITRLRLTGDSLELVALGEEIETLVN